MDNEQVAPELASGEALDTGSAAALLSKMKANERPRAPSGQFQAKEPAETPVEAEEPAKVVDLKGQPVEPAAEAPADEDEDPEFEIAAEEEGKEPTRVKLSEMWDRYQKAAELEKTVEELRQHSTEVPDQFFQAIEESNKVRAAYAERLNLIESLIRPQAPSIAMVDPNSPDYDPERYHALARKYQDDTKLLNAVAVEREKISAQQEEDNRRAAQVHNAREWAKVERAWPEIKDQATQEAYIKTLRSYGYTDKEIKANSDSRAFQIVRDAMKYRELAAKKEETAKVVRSKPKLVKGAARSATNPANTARANALARLRETGSVDAAAAALKGLI